MAEIIITNTNNKSPEQVTVEIQTALETQSDSLEDNEISSISSGDQPGTIKVTTGK